jgi:hypothetical protein
MTQHFYYQYQRYVVLLLGSLEYIKVRENRSGNQEWTIKRHWQHWTHKKQDEDKQSITQHNRES